MLERPSAAGGQLEVSEVEIEGWARSCGEFTVTFHLPLFCPVRKILSAEQECSDWGGDKRRSGRLRTAWLAEGETPTQRLSLAPSSGQAQVGPFQCQKQLEFCQKFPIFSIKALLKEKLAILTTDINVLLEEQRNHMEILPMTRSPGLENGTGEIMISFWSPLETSNTGW